ncbi:MAG: YtxH domain-containing protein [Vicinamibacteria bacterium]
MSNEGGGANFLVGLFVGAALGVMAALLLAPKARKEIEDKLAEEGRKLREKAEAKLADLRGAGEDLAGRSREAYSETAQGVKKAARAFSKS